ncbi:Non-specific lipid transfer protein GPI-anchored 1 [Camellia lanceoleosa]|uniref:Non-specific lipid transfer protein GPI-anchored 1 n=1 Tax=Camellia lanceoleosa TaxID=1840588 RepID=A0ACC0ICJ7_9ERIC|nr:Non-specific lipid transfer protein GPI-anchored 1 [Camellia lanceoleosa]
MGIQESRLLHLPSACKLTNASVSDCPKLLNIPSTSPDYAIFTNSSSTTSPSTVTRTSSPSTANDSSGTIRTEHVPQLIGLVTIAMAIFLLLSPVEVVSTFCT